MIRENIAFWALVLSIFLTSAHCCERNGLKCLDYTVTESHEHYEERSYPALVWVSTTENGRSKANVTRKLIKRIYGYLGGANDKKENLDMVLPVRTAKVVHTDYNQYTMSVALDAEHRENPPQPMNELVTIHREPPTQYFVRSFGGMARGDSIWDDQATTLRGSVDDDSSMNTTFYYICIYDSPWRLTERLNEVWMVKLKD